MRPALKLLFLLLLTSCFLSAKETNYLVPDLQFVWSDTFFNDQSGIGVLAEVGNQNFRLSETYGVALSQCARIKFTGEGLAQKLRYDDFATNERAWAFQYALGSELEFLVNRGILQTLEMGAAYSHAFGRHLKHSSSGRIQRLADSDGGYAFIGPSLQLAACTQFFASLDYDFVKYHRKFNPERQSNGFGATLELIQQLPANFSLTLDTELTAPYNFYQGLLSWCSPNKPLSTGLYANFTDGRKGVPNVMTAGIRLDLSFGLCKELCDPCVTNRKEIASYVATPAIYVPVVLSVADPQGPFTCSTLSLSPSNNNLGNIAGTTFSTVVAIAGTGPFTGDVVLVSNNLAATVVISGNTITIRGTRIGATGPFQVVYFVRDACGRTAAGSTSGVFI